MMNYCYEYFSCRYLSFFYYLYVFFYFTKSSYCTALFEMVEFVSKKIVCINRESFNLYVFEKYVSIRKSRRKVYCSCQAKIIIL